MAVIKIQFNKDSIYLLLNRPWPLLLTNAENTRRTWEGKQREDESSCWTLALFSH